MIEETIYSDSDLESGICTCCNEESEEILIDDGRCIDCIEDEKFINATQNTGNWE